MHQPFESCEDAWTNWPSRLQSRRERILFVLDFTRPRFLEDFPDSVTAKKKIIPVSEAKATCSPVGLNLGQYFKAISPAISNLQFTLNYSMDTVTMHFGVCQLSKYCIVLLVF